MYFKSSRIDNVQFCRRMRATKLTMCSAWLWPSVFGISNTLIDSSSSLIVDLDNSLLLFHESFWKFCFYFHQIIWCQSSALDYWHSIFSVQSITNPLIESVMNNIFHDLWCSLMSLSITVIRQAMLWSLMTPIQNVIITVIRIICANLIIIHVIV